MVWDKDKKDQYVVFDKRLNTYYVAKLLEETNGQVLYGHTNNYHTRILYYDKNDCKAYPTDCELCLPQPLVMEEGG